MSRLARIVRDRSRTRVFAVTDQGERISTLEADERQPNEITGLIADTNSLGYLIAWGSSCIGRPGKQSSTQTSFR